MNTFNQSHLESIQKKVTEANAKALVKRSKVYLKAVVIGVPEEPGSLILSLVDDEIEQRSYWLLNIFLHATPKEVADGKADFSASSDKKFYHWAEMLKYVECCAITNFKETSFHLF